MHDSGCVWKRWCISIHVLRPLTSLALPWLSSTVLAMIPKVSPLLRYIHCTPWSKGRSRAVEKRGLPLTLTLGAGMKSSFVHHKWFYEM